VAPGFADCLAPLLGADVIEVAGLRGAKVEKAGLLTAKRTRGLTAGVGGMCHNRRALSSAARRASPGTGRRLIARVGVRGHSHYNDAVVGLSDGKARNGVFGFNSNTSGAAVGVLGQCDSPQGVGVRGSSGSGYGASFNGGLAPLRIEPASTKGAPAIGAHLTGELFVDSLGDLYFCKAGGVGPAAMWVKLT
jgi:hypothetical protein